VVGLSQCELNVSISKFQEKFLSEKGCGTFMAIGFTLVLVCFGFNTQCARMNAMGGGGDAGDVPPIATVGDIPVAQNDVTDIISHQQQGRPSQGYLESAYEQANAVDTALKRAANLYLARQMHASFDDASITKVMSDQISSQIMQAKMQLAQTKKLKPTDTKAMDDAFKAQFGGRTADELTKGMMDQLKTALADKSKRPIVEMDVAPELLEKAVEAQINPTDAELRASYDTYVTKQITVSPKPGSDPTAQILQAQNALKGGMSFEAAMEKYSTAPAMKGKKKSDQTSDIPVSEINFMPSYKELEGKQPGYVSGVLDSFMGKQIIKIVSVKNNAPKDLTKNRAVYVQTYAGQQASTQVQDKLKALLASSTVKWDSAGYRALDDYEQAAMNPDPISKAAALQKVQNEAKAARDGGRPGDAGAALAAWYLAFDQIYQMPTTNKDSMRDARIELLTAVLASNEDFGIRMELVKLYADKKDGKDAVLQLVTASKNNTLTDATGQKNFGDVAQEKEKLQTAGLTTPADIKAIDDAQAAYVKLRDDSAKQTAQQAEEQKKADAENAKLIKQQEAELAKTKAAAAPSNPTAPAVKATTPPAGAGAPAVKPTAPPAKPASPPAKQ